MTVATVRSDIRAACRTLLATVEKASATSTGFAFSGATITRTTGSFLDDGFDEGDALTVAGAATAGNNGATRITAVTALVITTARTFTAGAAGPSITLTAKPPSERAWEGRKYAPTSGVPFIEEGLAPITSRPAGIGGVQYHRLALNLVLVYPAGRGARAIERAAGAILKAFKPGTSISYGAAAGMVMQAEGRDAFEDGEWQRLPCVVTVDVNTEE